MKTTIAKNYHGEIATFAVGEKIKFVADCGEILTASVEAVIDEGTLELKFKDNEDGVELTANCYHP